MTITKDSYKDEISTIMKKVADSRGESTIRDEEDPFEPRDPGSGSGPTRSRRTIRRV